MNVIVKATTERVSPTPDVPSSLAAGQISAATPQLFSESLLIASRVLPKSGSVNDANLQGTRQPKLSSDAKRTEDSIPHGDGAVARRHPQASVSSRIPLPPPAPITSLPHIQAQMLSALPMATPMISSLVPVQDEVHQESPEGETLAVSQSLEGSISDAIPSGVANVPALAGASSSADAPLNGAQKISIRPEVSQPVSNLDPGPLPDIEDGASSAGYDLEKVSIPHPAAADVSRLRVDAGSPSAARTSMNEFPKELATVPLNANSAEPVVVPAGVCVSGTGSSAVIGTDAAACSEPGSPAEMSGRFDLSGMNPSQQLDPSARPFAHDEIKPSAITNELTGPKQHMSSTTDQTGSVADVQGEWPAYKQSQDGTASQSQNALPGQTNSIDHSAALTGHGQTIAIASVPQTGPATASSPGTAVRMPGETAPVTTVVAQSSPVINTARLIQTMNQSEMRVGMRSSEFGNISINTFAAKDLISAQILVDHGELARTIAASLPDMQSRLGGNHGVDVRIELNRDGMGQVGGASSGMPDSPAGQSQNGRQHRGNSSSSYAGDGLGGQLLQPAAALTTSEGRMNARLDIRV